MGHEPFRSYSDVKIRFAAFMALAPTTCASNSSMRRCRCANASSNGVRAHGLTSFWESQVGICRQRRASSLTNVKSIHSTRQAHRPDRVLSSTFPHSLR